MGAGGWGRFGFGLLDGVYEGEGFSKGIARGWLFLSCWVFREMLF